MTGTTCVRGNVAGAVYTSFTMEAGANDGRWSSGIHAVLNDNDIDVDPDGNYEIAIGGTETDAQPAVDPARRRTHHHARTTSSGRCRPPRRRRCTSR